MGGVSFRTAQTEPIDWKSFALDVWWDAMKAANEQAIVDNAKCPFDHGDECFKRGCLNENGQRGWTMPIRDLLLSAERTLAFVRAYPEKLSDQQTVCVANGVVFSREHSQSDFEISQACDSQHDEFYPGIVFAIPLLERFVQQIKHAIDKGAESITMLDRMTDADLYPCPRSWYTKRLLTVEEIDEDLKHEWGLSEGVIEESILPYDEAIKKQSNGEWKTMIQEIYP